jgi:hypothetical protein
MGAVCSLEAALLTRNVLKLVLYEPGMNVTGEDIYPTWVHRSAYTRFWLSLSNTHAIEDRLISSRIFKRTFQKADGYSSLIELHNQDITLQNQLSTETVDKPGLDKMNYPAASGRGINKENIFNIAASGGK